MKFKKIETLEMIHIIIDGCNGIESVKMPNTIMDCSTFLPHK